ncbi:enoyl-CoA hydratase/isomerase family protein [Halomarina litorea]|uniref:enoyl-CoA hydratase/isomerase family protein n=1 Tax=Halomarina litorea TaxID=2961595 RepID=UPI0020C3C3D6|nr:enoyl-CoA hydratase/isomerase family protein [Halomarina sp. BCD28]
MPVELEAVEMSREDSIAWLTIDRVEKHNALSLQVIEDLITAVEAVHEDDHSRVIVVRGDGKKAFSAGADISEFAERDASEQLHYNRRLGDLCELLDTGPVPTIAGVNGVAFGGGAELLLSCDIRVASTNGSFSEAEINVGVVPMAKRLIDLVGYGVAAELCLTGRTVDADEAADLKIFNRVVEPGDLDEAIREMADSIIEKTSPSVELTKETLVAARDNPTREANVHQLVNFHQAFETDEAQDRIQAFLNRK